MRSIALLLQCECANRSWNSCLKQNFHHGATLCSARAKAFYFNAQPDLSGLRQGPMMYTVYVFLAVGKQHSISFNIRVESG